MYAKNKKKGYKRQNSGDRLNTILQFTVWAIIPVKTAKKQC